MLKRKSYKKSFLNRPRKKCRFCKAKTEIDYKNVRLLKAYLGDSARILPAQITGNCAKHQRVLTNAIKRARQIALLPYTI